MSNKEWDLISYNQSAEATKVEFTSEPKPSLEDILTKKLIEANMRVLDLERKLTELKAR